MRIEEREDSCNKQKDGSDNRQKLVRIVEVCTQLKKEERYVICKRDLIEGTSPLSRRRAL